MYGALINLIFINIKTTQSWPLSTTHPSLLHVKVPHKTIEAHRLTRLLLDLYLFLELHKRLALNHMGARHQLDLGSPKKLKGNLFLVLILDWQSPSPWLSATLWAWYHIDTSAKWTWIPGCPNLGSLSWVMSLPSHILGRVVSTFTLKQQKMPQPSWNDSGF